MTFTVRFWSEHLESPEYIGPFYSEDDAQEYADDRNSSLALSGIPSSVACYSVVWIMNTQLLSVREQIQQDILTYASFVDDEKIFFNDEVLDELCEIVVRNFEKLN